jgi:hypothetical protein
MIGATGSIVRPHGFRLAQQPPIAVDGAQFGWKARLRQSALVHGVAQRVGRSSRTAGRRTAITYAGNGYHYEADEVRARVEQGERESVIMPLADSIAVADTIDKIRRDISQVRHPIEGV